MEYSEDGVFFNFKICPFVDDFKEIELTEEEFAKIMVPCFL